MGVGLIIVTTIVLVGLSTATARGQEGGSRRNPQYKGRNDKY